MAARRRTDKKRTGVGDNAFAWLEGRPCGFFEFKPHDELVALWLAHGDTNIAEWDLDKDSRPVAIEK
jgi:hypothetical protein